jgi:uncharacterized protein YecE (DUF72 family)
VIRIGTSGFSYADWQGPFYPPSVPKSKWFDYYSAQFDCLEINSSYYSWLPPRTLQSLVDRSPPGFLFAIKLHGSVTHERADLKEAMPRTQDQVAPLVAAGQFAGFLAQFPYSFLPDDINARRVGEIAAFLSPLVVEFRNAAWHGHPLSEPILALGVVPCTVDGPALRGLPAFEIPPSRSPAYIRFHGRNASKWYDHDSSWERYDYLYSEGEIELRATQIAAACAGRDALVFFNNHYGAQAVTNARQLARRLGVGRPDPQPGLF